MGPSGTDTAMYPETWCPQKAQDWSSETPAPIDSAAGLPPTSYPPQPPLLPPTLAVPRAMQRWICSLSPHTFTHIYYVQLPPAHYPVHRVERDKQIH